MRSRTLPWLLVALAGAARADDPPAPRPGASAIAAAIDSEVEAALGRRGLEPSPLCDDATFLRRAWLDALGSLPAPAEVEAFLRDRDPGKRARLIGELLARPEAARRAAELWTQELSDGPARDGGVALIRGAFQEWLGGELLQDRPWDQLAARVLAGEGRTDRDPALGWLLERAGTTDPADVAGPALRQLLGLRLECARCHDHPFQRWTQAEFHGVAAFFARLHVRPEPGMVAVFRVSEAPVGEHRVAFPGAAKVEVAPALLGATALTPGATPAGVTRTSRRAELARWATSPQNPWFARAAVNRVWARLFGRGLVEPVDDLLAAAADAPLRPLLDELAQRFVEDGFSLRRLQAGIMSSRAWQRAAVRADDRFAAARELGGTARVRPLDGGALAEALLAAAGRARPGPGEPVRIHQALRERLRAELQGAIPLAGAARDADQVTTAQALAALVGPATTGLVRGPLVTAVLAAGEGQEARLRDLWLRTVGRAPGAAEVRRARAHLGGGERAAWEDLAWALVAGSEFHTNH